MTYKYYVTYQHKQGYGCATVTREGRIDSIEQITSIAKAIEDSSAKDVCITNFILLEIAD